MSRALLASLALASASSAAPLPRPSRAFPLRSPHAAAESQQLAVIASLRGGAVTMPSSKVLHYAVQTVVPLACLCSVILMANAMRFLYTVAKQPTLSASGKSNRKWNLLRDQLRFSGASDTKVSGKAAKFEYGPRSEAARALVMNHARVLHDIIRADGPPKSQPQLKRIPGKEAFVDAALYETARRLVGCQPGQRERLTHPTSAEEAKAWAATSHYLTARIQSTCEEVASVPGHEERAPDMSMAAAAAMRGVLSEIEEEEPVTSSIFSRMKNAVMHHGEERRPAAIVGP